MCVKCSSSQCTCRQVVLTAPPIISSCSSTDYCVLNRKMLPGAIQSSSAPTQRGSFIVFCFVSAKHRLSYEKVGFIFFKVNE